jgi:hypothetical protein
VSIDADQEPDKSGVPRRTALSEHDRHKRGGERGSVVSRQGLFQDLLVQGQIRDNMAQPDILLLKILQPLGLVRSEPAIFLAPPIIALLGHAKVR